MQHVGAIAKKSSGLGPRGAAKTCLALTGGAAAPEAKTPAELEAEITDLEALNQQLEASTTSNLYAGLVQGAIIGLVIGGTGAWIVSKRLKVVEVEEESESNA